MSRLLVLSLVLAGCGPSLPDPVSARCEALLACPAPVQAECAGPSTVVPLPEASVCSTATTSSDAPTAYPLGSSTVRWTSTLESPGTSWTATCSTPVTVVDTTRPEVTCEAEVVLVRADAAQPYPDVPTATASDTCDADVLLTVDPPTLDGPETQVVHTATDASGNSDTCTATVSVRDIWPVQDLRLLGATLTDADETELTLGWEPSGSDTTDVVLQRAPSAGGPWTEVDTVSEPRRFLTTTHTASTWYRLLSIERDLAGDLEGGATEPIRVRHVRATAYDIDGVTVPTVPFETTLYGRVRYPDDLADGAPKPLVVMMHGNHGNCRRNGTTDDYCATLSTHDCDFNGYSAAPNAEGMTFLADTLAARGMVAVTVSANALNCRGGYILERAQLLRTHLAAWSVWGGADRTTPPFDDLFSGHIDLSRVGTVGHSRGGDAVSQLPAALDQDPLPGVDVISTFAIAPTDYNDATVFDSDYAVLLPACDGDVSNLWGSDIYERSQDDIAHKSQVFIPGTNHNFYNTEWFFDDGTRVCSRSDLVGSRAQTTLLQATVGAWLARTLDGDRPQASHRAERPSPSGLDAWAGRDVDLRWAYAQGDATVVERFTGVLGGNDVGGSTTFTGFDDVAACGPGTCGASFLAPTPAVQLTWSAGDAPTVTTSLDSLDTSPFDAISFRVTSRRESANDGRIDQPFRVTLTDADGQTAALTQRDLVALPHVYGGYNIREVLQTVRVPFQRLEPLNADLDTTRLATIAVELGTDGLAGAVVLTDVRLEY